MADLTDERVRFYLRHQEHIEAWASLRSEAALAVDGLLESLVEEVESLTEELGVVAALEIEGAA